MEHLHQIRRPASSRECTELGPYCPVEATVLGYIPNRGSSIFFTVAFGIAFIAAVFLSVRSRTWTYGVALGAGLLLETIGMWFCPPPPPYSATMCED